MLLLLLLILGFTPSAAAKPLGLICGNIGNYTDESTYQANLGLLSKGLPRNASSTPALFAEGSVGAVPDMVHGLALCSGDANASACAKCVGTAFQDAQRLCPFNKDAAVFYDACLLRFSNFAYDSRSEGPADGFLFLTNSTAPMLPGWDLAGDAEGVNSITGIIKLLLNETARQAAWPAPDDTKLPVAYGTGHMYVSSTFPPLYAMAQCIPDEESVIDTACWNCLDTINVKFTARYFTGQQSGRVLGVRCHFRYETYQFYHGQPMRDIPWLGDAVPPPTLSVVPSQKHKSKILVIATVVPLMAILFCSISGFAWNKRHGKGSGVARIGPGPGPNGQNRYSTRAE